MHGTQCLEGLEASQMALLRAYCSSSSSSSGSRPTNFTPFWGIQSIYMK